MIDFKRRIIMKRTGIVVCALIGIYLLPLYARAQYGRIEFITMAGGFDPELFVYVATGTTNTESVASGPLLLVSVPASKKQRDLFRRDESNLVFVERAIAVPLSIRDLAGESG
jgi:hypothetical protein